MADVGLEEHEQRAGVRDVGGGLLDEGRDRLVPPVQVLDPLLFAPSLCFSQLTLSQLKQ